MYNTKNLSYICTMLECIEKIFIYSSNFDNVEDFIWANDQQNYNASWGLLLAIGEESKRLDIALKNEYPQIPWRNIAGMRNFLAHDYRGIDYDLVYEVINNNLPNLKEVLIEMVSKVDYDQSLLRDALDSPYYRHIQYLRNKLHD
ncbi:DUF86 domain-containing protein [Spirosoma sp. HMF3257]|uniref:DUF86 domain-containing protein n=1 Tax=Spirosoma telluris TaxID=2183553 RepID=A0A327NQB0_9BACT|nr:DUF86 domain-containing protein [Spirosoma telluris]RAI76903.1 hypothetical protein HMF3257_26935 [Spirosoma telluris]